MLTNAGAEVVMAHVFSLPDLTDRPRAGDIILRRTNAPSSRFTLATAGEAPQLTCATFEEAITYADAFAQCHNVDVWHTDDGRMFTRIVEGRAIDFV
jgi:hypothetical protein